MTIYLASNSSRRRELLSRVGLSFSLLPADADETHPGGAPQEIVLALSRRKGENAAKYAGKHDIIISADTLVAADGRVLGKPRSKDEAACMLAFLSGRWHSVFTGVTVRQGDREASFSQESRVKFRELSREEIARYVDTGEPMDKAGAYGIQNLGALLVEEIQGDFYNVVGLPLCRLTQVLRDFGVRLF